MAKHKAVDVLPIVVPNILRPFSINLRRPELCLQFLLQISTPQLTPSPNKSYEVLSPPSTTEANIHYTSDLVFSTKMSSQTTFGVLKTQINDHEAGI